MTKKIVNCTVNNTTPDAKEMAKVCIVVPARLCATPALPFSVPLRNPVNPDIAHVSVVVISYSWSVSSRAMPECGADRDKGASFGGEARSSSTKVHKEMLVVRSEMNKRSDSRCDTTDHDVDASVASLRQAQKLAPLTHFQPCAAQRPLLVADTKPHHCIVGASYCHLLTDVPRMYQPAVYEPLMMLCFTHPRSPATDSKPCTGARSLG